MKIRPIPPYSNAIRSPLSYAIDRLIPLILVAMLALTLGYTLAASSYSTPAYTSIVGNASKLGPIMHEIASQGGCYTVTPMNEANPSGDYWLRSKQCP